MGKFLTVAFACACCAAVVSSAIPAPMDGLEDKDGSAVMYLAPEQVVACKTQGGCEIFTHEELMEMAKEAAKIGAKRQCTGGTRVKL